MYSRVVQPFTYYFIFTVIFFGIMLTISIYFVTRYLLKKLPEYLFYALYIITFLVYFIHAVGLTFIHNHTYHANSTFISHTMQIGGHLLYIVAGVYFMELRKHLPKLYKIICLFAALCVLYCIVDAFLAFSDRFALASYIGFILIRLLLVSFSFYSIIILSRWKNPFAYYYILGAIGITVFGIIALFVGNQNGETSKFVFDVDTSTILFMTGIMIEVICFALGLTNKADKEDAERIKAIEALKIENEKKEFEKYIAVMNIRDDERNRIAQEIHDDIGAGLTSIRLLSEIAKARAKEEEFPEMDKISSSASTLVDKMNEIVWSLNSKNDSLPNLLAYIRSYAAGYFEHHNIALELRIPDEVPNYEINGEFRRNIFLVVKEAMHNILKHAQSTKVVLDITINQQLEIMISDNGVGIDMQKQHSYKQGIENMRQRMHQIGGRFSLTSQYGTIIKASLPLAGNKLLG
jgi:signal transduction histidine kinase